MGWTPVDRVTIYRDYTTRELVVEYKVADNKVLQVKRFKFDQDQEAFDFALKEFTQLAM